MLLKNFGLKVNGEAFYSLANSVDYSVVRKVQNSILDLEALLFGQAGLLEDEAQDTYFFDLKNNYQFLRQKFGLNNQGVLPLQFFRLRPQNFPTVRLSQFVNLYASEHQMFSKVLETNTIDGLYKLFSKGVTEYWKTHYTFKTVSKASAKNMSKSFIDLLVINTIIPLKFCYAKAEGKNIEQDLFELMKDLRIERNSVVEKYSQLRSIEKNALSSQGLLQLKTFYCDKNKCLQCAIGNSLIIKN
jgi:hypothetical protein